MLNIFSSPWRLVQNSFIRYPGGREIERFRGYSDFEDTMMSEAWIGSDTLVSIFPEGSSEFDGLAECILPDGRKMFVKDAIKLDPQKVLGPQHVSLQGERLGILMKLLDPKNQLELQVHPTREYAKENFACDYGKTECWYIIGLRDDTQEPNYVFLGFKEGISRARFEQLYNDGDIKAMEELCHKIPVKAGDMYYIEAGLPHAVGPGCFVLELQEASDITCTIYKPQDICGKELDSFTDLCMGAFNFTGNDIDDTIAKYRIEPDVLRSGEWGEEILLIGANVTKYFSLVKLTAHKPTKIRKTGTIQIGMVLNGYAKLVWGDREMNLKLADEFLIPFDTEEISIEPLETGVTIILGYPK